MDNNTNPNTTSQPLNGVTTNPLTEVAPTTTPSAPVAEAPLTGGVPTMVTNNFTVTPATSVETPAASTPAAPVAPVVSPAPSTPSVATPVTTTMPVAPVTPPTPVAEVPVAPTSPLAEDPDMVKPPVA